jgi:hypothetical protein
VITSTNQKNARLIGFRVSFRIRFAFNHSISKAIILDIESLSLLKQTSGKFYIPTLFFLLHALKLKGGSTKLKFEKKEMKLISNRKLQELLH